MGVIRPILVRLLVLPSLAFAEHWGFQVFGAEQGLSNLNVITSVQDHDGFLWFATEGGIFRYYGERFERIDAGEPGRRGAITGLHVSIDGQLWASSNSGLLRWNGRAIETVPGGERFQLFHNGSLSSDKTNLYLAGNSGVYSYPLSGRAPFVRLVEGRSAGVLSDSTGALWFTCGDQVCSLVGGLRRTGSIADGVPPGRWRAFAEDGQHRL